MLSHASKEEREQQALGGVEKDIQLQGFNQELDFSTAMQTPNPDGSNTSVKPNVPAEGSSTSAGSSRAGSASTGVSRGGIQKPGQIDTTHDGGANTTTSRTTTQTPSHYNAPPNLQNLHSKLRAKPSLLKQVKNGEESIPGFQRALQESVGAGLPSLNEVARRLCVSTRTLQRRLQEQGTSFRDELEQVRVEMAKNCLQAGDLSLADIANLLAYNDQSAFTHAFKRVTGVSPAKYQRTKRQ